MGGRESLDVEELIRENENLREQRQALDEVLRAVARSEGLQPVLDAIIEAATRLCHGSYGQLYLAEGDVFVIASQVADLAETYDYATEHPHVRDRTTVVGRAAVAGEAVQIPDVLADADYSFGAQAIIGYRALLGVPVILDDKLIGVVSVARSVPGPFTEREVELVKTFADQAAIAIANARLLDTVERQRMELSRFLSPQVAELISSEQGEQLLAGHRAYITCLFSDLRGFTSFAETAAPEELFEVLRPYHETIGELIPYYGGTLEHFAGDGILVFFNDPVVVDDHELAAVRRALAAQERFEELARTWRKRDTDLGLGIGIEAGYATVGRIGFEGRYDYAALGSVTNLSSRLSTHAVAGQTLVGPRVFAAVEESVLTEPVGGLDLKGFGRPIPAYEVRGLRTSE
ncbi:MAG TPA: GAF domain-containing protein [Actinomycetota bacterium]|nr:GAF domain-containing protein [Actinomycetota bacterium]